MYKEDDDKRITGDVDQSSSPISSLPTSPSAYEDEDEDDDDDDDDDDDHVYSQDVPRHQQQQQQQPHHALKHHLHSLPGPTFSSPLFRSPPHPSMTTYDADEESGDGDEGETQNEPDDDSIDSSHEDHGGDDLTQDSKDVLIERLTDLVQRLSASRDRGSGGGGGGYYNTSIKEASLSALHAKVDEMEALMATVPLPPVVNGKTPTKKSTTTTTKRGLGSPALLRNSTMSFGVGFGAAGQDGQPPSGGGGGNELWGSKSAPLTPLLAPPLQLAASGPGPSLVAGVARLVVDEADRLSAQLASAVKGLQQRREESDHLHAMLVDRAEAAAARILELEKVVFDLEDEVSGNESELRHLRLELRAVEALCNTLLPSDVDPDLVESIQNWKSDWQRLRDKMSARKKDRYQLRKGGAAAVEGVGVEESSFVSITNLSILGAGQSPSKLC
ncbi:hypothetical protein B0T19DRAFT_403603 [Cercophora scortea]|uniref:Uncharacterized protein n=1 Tax=Cercophora scortea TaxID=314031 RepID=A0AAE0I9L6_9PEZI|nr:hypothetical protein B0T19DRAFT_403603 [Cercophora scortea]